MRFPGRRELAENDRYAAIATGRELKPDNARVGRIDDGNAADEERISEAERLWPRARIEDFERTGKRTYVDRASGVEYKA